MRGMFTGALLLAIAVSLGGCWRTTYEWNQKLTVEVATPNGPRAGSAVIHEQAISGVILLSGNRAEYHITGEATVVEVAPGKYLFALLGEYTKSLASAAWRAEMGNDADRNWSIIEAKRESIALPPKFYPLLVTFTDITDPRTVKQVDPTNLAASFGPGYALKSITLEITDEEVTDGEVQKILPWIGDSKVMENPNWKTLPKLSREAIGGLLTDFKKAQTR
jgi:hypothetical protein